MTYELAKQLKDAGFPLRKPGQERVYFEIVEEGKSAGIFIYPTLSELIEACGDRFYHLRKSVKWFAAAMFDPTDVRELWGDTPEEAVAKLWLALNTEKPRDELLDYVKSRPKNIT
jgi:serine/threonine protein kinase HipA of HipAB toxin-antitoxin module